MARLLWMAPHTTTEPAWLSEQLLPYYDGDREVLRHSDGDRGGSPNPKGRHDGPSPSLPRRLSSTSVAARPPLLPCWRISWIYREAALWLYLRLPPAAPPSQQAAAAPPPPPPAAATLPASMTDLVAVPPPHR